MPQALTRKPIEELEARSESKATDQCLEPVTLGNEASDLLDVRPLGFDLPTRKEEHPDLTLRQDRNAVNNWIPETPASKNSVPRVLAVGVAGRRKLETSSAIGTAQHFAVQPIVDPAAV
jgi:hypothetical protein